GDYIYYDMDGLYLWIVLQNQTATLLRSNPGDLVVNSNNGDVLVGNSLGQWIFDGTNLKGPIGPTGEPGQIGPMGNPGIQGPQGPTGIPLGSASFVTDILPTDFVLIANNQGSLINFVPISLDTSSLPVGTIITSTFVNKFSTQRRLEIDMTINNVLFASPLPINNEIGAGQHLCGVLTIDLSTYFINQGFFESFLGNPSIVAQVQQDDIAINRGYQNNIFSSLSNGSNQIKLVIVYYNPGPTSVDITTFQTLINISVKISGIVSSI
ncbi:MAG: collagen-like protein, partial [Candidatus Paceibacterota bacterium]